VPKIIRNATPCKSVVPNLFVNADQSTLDSFTGVLCSRRYFLTAEMKLPVWTIR